MPSPWLVNQIQDTNQLTELKILNSDERFRKNIKKEHGIIKNDI